MNSMINGPYRRQYLICGVENMTEENFEHNKDVYNAIAEAYHQKSLGTGLTPVTTRCSVSEDVVLSKEYVRFDDSFFF